MNKIREEFEKWINEYFEYHIDLSKSKNGDYRNSQTHDMWQACKSRDKELAKWRDRNDKQEARIIDQDAEIKKLRDVVRLVTNGLSVNQRGIAMDVINDIDVFYLLNLIEEVNYDNG